MSEVFTITDSATQVTIEKMFINIPIPYVVDYFFKVE